MNAITGECIKVLKGLISAFDCGLCDNTEGEFQALSKAKDVLIKLEKSNDSYNRELLRKSIISSRVGMYGQMPTVIFGNISVARMTDNKNESKVWFQDEDSGEDFEIDGNLLQEEMQKIFDENI